MTQKYELTKSAKHDPAHCLVPGLFRSLKRGERKKEKLDLKYHFSDDKNEFIRFVCYEPLDALDLRVLQGVLALATKDSEVLSSSAETQESIELRSLLEMCQWSIQQDTLLVDVSYRRLFQEIGMPTGGSNLKTVKDSLWRLSNIGIGVFTKGGIVSFKMMNMRLDFNTGEWQVIINPRLTAAVLGRSKYTHIDMEEVRAIKHNVTRLIHQRLCGWIDLGDVKRVGIDKLCSYCWPDGDEEITKNAIKWRKKKVREALKELNSLGWFCSEYERGKFEIKRPFFKQ